MMISRGETREMMMISSVGVPREMPEPISRVSLESVDR